MVIVIDIIIIKLPLFHIEPHSPVLFLLLFIITVIAVVVVTIVIKAI